MLGESPPQDHPHIYINMGPADTILCPYCGTQFRFDPRLTPLEADPPDSLFADQNSPERHRSGPLASGSAPGGRMQKSARSGFPIRDERLQYFPLEKL